MSVLFRCLANPKMMARSLTPKITFPRHQGIIFCLTLCYTGAVFLNLRYEVMIKLMFNCIVKAYHLHSISNTGITFGSFLLVAINRLFLDILQTILTQ